MSYITPKTDWTPSNGILHTDFNRIEGNILDFNTRLASVESTVDALRKSLFISGSAVAEFNSISRKVAVTLQPGETLKAVYLRMAFRSAIASLTIGTSTNNSTWSDVSIQTSTAWFDGTKNITLRTNSGGVSENIWVRLVSSSYVGLADYGDSATVNLEIS